MNPLLDIRDLRLELQRTRKESVAVLDGVSLSVGKGETVGIVGESGCGKSVLSLSILGLQPNAMRITGGEMWYKEEHPLHGLKEHEIRRYRGSEIAMVFQDPMSSLNNGLTVGAQVTEMFRLHSRCSRAEAKERAIALFRRVGLARPEALLKEYPHQLSGGMRQRIMIAIAISCNPGLLIADEPTTALDVTIQAQILDLMRQIREENDTAIMLISHDLGVIADMCDRIAVMYAGQIVEEGPTAAIFEDPRHPYTIGLLQSIPAPSKKREKLFSIPGTVPGLAERQSLGCRFAPRCGLATKHCYTEAPLLFGASAGHAARCWLLAERGGQTDAVVS
ncbi:ABC transporter ATP-binding protein [Paenibacillus radicis (ex Gao et al. 2016)]|uniref:Peptide ABC transporter ATP-binding protein n=1 Tax=Paenibacillus radicis (ex Gao et al. 2016) TaxID=1737354 RepID=A0A917LWL3_9BACL|nr:ABC transporter ATP-binding protein [Paenibacillus radicis (ex Gao et al. 2016)]GGG63645.1 peptide ABC transporter ATP-binding protein [Paenibacillus radicis (ex Gao et al. 2016)]